jgi:hypothetical protein
MTTNMVLPVLDSVQATRPHSGNGAPRSEHEQAPYTALLGTYDDRRRRRRRVDR